MDRSNPEKEGIKTAVIAVFQAPSGIDPTLKKKGLRRIRAFLRTFHVWIDPTLKKKGLRPLSGPISMPRWIDPTLKKKGLRRDTAQTPLDKAKGIDPTLKKKGLRRRRINSAFVMIWIDPTLKKKGLRR